MHHLVRHNNMSLNEECLGYFLAISQGFKIKSLKNNLNYYPSVSLEVVELGKTALNIFKWSLPLDNKKAYSPKRASSKMSMLHSLKPRFSKKISHLGIAFVRITKQDLEVILFIQEITFHRKLNFSGSKFLYELPIKY